MIKTIFYSVLKFPLFCMLRTHLHAVFSSLACVTFFYVWCWDSCSIYILAISNCGNCPVNSQCMNDVCQCNSGYSKNNTANTCDGKLRFSFGFFTSMLMRCFILQLLYQFRNHSSVFQSKDFYSGTTKVLRACSLVNVFNRLQSNFSMGP